MARFGTMLLALAVGIAATAILAPGSSAQQLRGAYQSFPSETFVTAVKASSKKKTARKTQRTRCVNDGGMGYTCRPQGHRTCCCDGPLGSYCYSQE